jgi:acetyl esterase/lipase
MLATTIPLHAEPAAAIPLWPDGAPGALGKADQDTPTLTPYLPDAGTANGGAIVICPGGGYWGLAPHEGNDYALYLNQQGVTCFVLKYRLAQHGYHHPSMMLDVQRAIRLVRARAAEWKLDPQRIGVMGSSAGGHLASTAATHFDEGKADATDPIERVSCRPDLGILCYAVITMGEFTHSGSKKNLIGENPAPDLVKLMSNEQQVTSRTPPCFVWHTQEDSAVPVENSLAFAAALQKAKVPFDLHVYQKGRHGIGLVGKPPGFDHLHPWGRELVFWLQEQGWVKR